MIQSCFPTRVNSRKYSCIKTKQGRASRAIRLATCVEVIFMRPCMFSIENSVGNDCAGRCTIEMAPPPWPPPKRQGAQGRSTIITIDCHGKKGVRLAQKPMPSFGHYRYTSVGLLRICGRYRYATTVDRQDTPQRQRPAH